MTSLLDLSNIKDTLLDAICEALENPDPDDPNCEAVLQSQLAELETQIADKVDAIAAVCAAKQAEINYLIERREHFSKLVDSRQKAIDRFKSYLKSALESKGVSSMVGKEAKLRLVKNGGKAPVWIDSTIDAREFPSDCVIERISYNVSTEFIRERLSELGTNELIINGRLLAQIQERGTHLRIG
jgi:hypothetical protein